MAASGLDSSRIIVGNVPLQGVIITVDGAEQELRTTTDAQGYFRLAPTPAGRFFVHVDGRTATNNIVNGHLPWYQRDYYPVVGKAWEAVAGQTNNLPNPTGNIYLPLVESGTLQPVSPNTNTVITFPPAVLQQNPQLEGVSITVPANSLFDDIGVRGGMVGIAPVPADRLPEPLPPHLTARLVITVQTDGPMNFDRPVPVRFPNLEGLAPGEKMLLFSFNHDVGRWEVAGTTTISDDGRFADSDPGTGIRQPGWHLLQVGTVSQGQPCNDQSCLLATVLEGDVIKVDLSGSVQLTEVYDPNFRILHGS